MSDTHCYTGGQDKDCPGQGVYMTSEGEGSKCGFEGREDATSHEIQPANCWTTLSAGKTPPKLAYSSREELSVKMSEMKRPATKRLQVLLLHSILCNARQVQLAARPAIGSPLFWRMFIPQWKRTTSPDTESHLPEALRTPASQHSYSTESYSWIHLPQQRLRLRKSRDQEREEPTRKLI